MSDLDPDSAAERCGCGCNRPRAAVVREVARSMFLSEDQADAIVPALRARLEGGEQP